MRHSHPENTLIPRLDKGKMRATAGGGRNFLTYLAQPEKKVG